MAYIVVADIKAALNTQVYRHLFDDDGDSAVADADPGVLLVIERAHAEVISYLPSLYETLPADAPAAVPLLLKSAELDFAIAFAIDRRPELANTAVGGVTRDARWKRAQDKMDRIVSSVQRITEHAPTTSPKNVGGQVLSGDPDNPDIVHVFTRGMGDF